MIQNQNDSIAEYNVELQQKTRHQTKFYEMLNPAPRLCNDGKCTGH